jgi:c-di-GMP phosphodiesterase
MWMRFLARQPILDRKRELFAYELLFRSAMEDSFDNSETEQASLSMFDISFLIGLQRVTGGERAFVKCRRIAVQR